MKFYQSKLLNQFSNLTHAFTTKQSKNLAFHVNDILQNVLQNHQNLAEDLNYNIKTVVHMKQIHSDRVKIVSTDDNFENPPTCDALITNKKNIPLMVMVADCSPILFYDDVKKVIAVAHAGRAGAFKNICANVIYSFVNEFSSCVSDIKVSIGPAICKDCYEVGKEIYEEATQLKLDYALTKKEHGYYLDIRAILDKQLREAGIKQEHLEISALCSQCDANFFSYREEKKCGRFAGVLLLR
jgi:YfiH family protein